MIIISGLEHLHSAENHGMLVPWTRTQPGWQRSTLQPGIWNTS